MAAVLTFLKVEKNGQNLHYRLLSVHR